MAFLSSLVAAILFQDGETKIVDGKCLITRYIKKDSRLGNTAKVGEGTDRTRANSEIKRYPCPAVRALSVVRHFVSRLVLLVRFSAEFREFKPPQIAPSPSRESVPSRCNKDLWSAPALLTVPLPVVLRIKYGVRHPKEIAGLGARAVVQAGQTEALHPVLRQRVASRVQGPRWLVLLVELLQFAAPVAPQARLALSGHR